MPGQRRRRAPASATGRGGSGCAATRRPALTQPGDGDDHAERPASARPAARGGRVEDGVDADADAAQPEQHQRAGAPPLGRGARRAGAAVAAGVHAGGQRAATARARPRAPAPGTAAAGRPGRSSPPRSAWAARTRRTLSANCGQHGDRDDQRGADLVERRRHRAQQPLGVGQRVGRADADHDRGQPQAVVEPGEQRLEGHRPEQRGSRRPSRAAGPRAGRAAPCRRTPPPKRTRNTTRITTITTPEPARRAGTTRAHGWSERRSRHHDARPRRRAAAGAAGWW